MLSQSKFLLLISSSLGLLLFLLFIASRLILLPSFMELEEKEARANVKRVLNVLSEETEALSSLALDYAGWDDTYRFAVDGNREYIRKNLGDTFFDKFRLNFVMVVNNKGELVYHGAYDLEKKRPAPFPQGLRSLLTPGNPLLKHARTDGKHEGIISIPEGTIQLSSLPITTSEFRGPIRGALLAGRFLNPPAVDRISAITRLSLHLYSINDPSLPVSPSSLSSEGPPRLLPGKGFVSGYSLLPDISGRRAAIVRVDTPRTTYQQGIRTIFYFMLCFAGFSVLIAALSNSFARKFMLVRRSGEESRSRYQAIVEAFDGLLCISSPDSRIVFLNRKFMELSGRNPVGEDCRVILRDVLGIESGGDVEAVFQGETVRREAYSPGGDKWYYVVDSPVFHMDGAISRLTMLADITESKRASREREKLEAQLQQSRKMEAVGLLAGGIAHDFNNILCAIVGFATLLRMSIPREHPDGSHVDQILFATDRAANLIKSLLIFSRKQVIDPRPEDLNQIVRSLEKILRRVMTEDIELKLALSGRRMGIMADASQIDQALINLAANARDAMPHGGVLTIATARSTPPVELLAEGLVTPLSSYALLTVSDTGTGMESWIRERIFDPFFTTKEVGKGTGLGLAAVYGIVKQHNGHIAVESEPGKGTAFRIWLPLAEDTVPALMEPSYESSPSFNGNGTILIAEDDQVLRLLNRMILEKAGYRVIEAENGEAAISIFRKHEEEIDLLLMDLVMPKMNGRKAYDEIRVLRPGIRVIFVSGYAADIIAEKNISTEGFRFIQKPMKPVELLKAVSEELERVEAGRDEKPD